MKALLQTAVVDSSRRVHHTQCLRSLRVRRARHFGCKAVHDLGLSKELSWPEPPSFEDLGLCPSIVTSLQAAFPNVKYPTETQTRFIPAVLSGKDVLLKDDTGSGKSFGLILALLSKPRLRFEDNPAVKSLGKRSVTSLIIVPHRDLAYQLLYWIQRIVSSHITHPPPSISSMAQVIVRDGTAHLASRLSMLRQEPPHILIGTPQALMDVVHADLGALQLPLLSTVVVDEVDSLIETVPMKNPNKSFKRAFVKANKKVQKHPGVTRELLDMIYTGRKEASRRMHGVSGVPQQTMHSASFDKSHSAPQLILASATLRRHLNNYVFDESGWLNQHNLEKVKGVTQMSRSSVQGGAGEHQSLTNHSLGGSDLSHSILVVSEDGVKNVAGAVRAENTSVDAQGCQIISPETIFASPRVSEAPKVDRESVKKYANTPSPFNPNTIEAIAIAFTLDVPSVALLVLPSSAPLQRAVYELREIGVNAHGLDLMADDKGRVHLLAAGGAAQESPTLLVCTLSTIRGLDLPELTHVFILGASLAPKVNGRAIDAYLHTAGRVGRFGRTGGKVITVVEQRDDESFGVTEATKMLRILKGIPVTPVQFEHFD